MQLVIEARDFERILQPLAAMPGELRKALSRTMKRTGAFMATSIRQGIKAESFLKAGYIKDALSKPLLQTNGNEMKIEVRVSGKQQPIDRFKLLPNRITARKGPNRRWKSPAYQIGPHEPVRQLDKSYFAARFKSGGKILLMQRKGKGKGNFQRAYGYSVQYFAAFDATSRNVLDACRAYFGKRLEHEVQYILGKLQ